MRMRHSHRAALLSLFLLLELCMLDAQTSDIYGVVSDSVTKQRIPFANVTVVSTNRGAASNNVGFYLIPKLPPGTYELSASVIGFIRVVKSVTVRPGQSIETNFLLPPTTIESKEVLVSGTRKSLELERSTSVHVLEKQDIKMIPVTAQQDLLQALKILPGIVSTSDVSSRFYVRGGAGDQNLFLFDGIRIYNPFHALGIFSVFNPNVVDNVEVYTGAFPPGFGGRLSSVVNIMTRDGRADRISARANVNLLSMEAEVEGPAIENSSWFLDVRRSLSSQTFNRIVGEDIPVSFFDGTFKMSLQPSGVQKFNLTILSSGDNLLSRDPDQPDYSWRNAGISISGTDLPTDRLFVQWQVYGSSYSATRDSKISTTITPASTSVKHYGIRTSATVYTGPKDLYYFGFEFASPALDYSFFNRIGTQQDIQSTFFEASAWARYQADIGDLQIDAGVHAELAPLLEGGQAWREIQPRLNLNYLAIGTWRVKASYGRFTQRMLTVGNEDDIISIFDAWIKVPSNLPPEQADHYVLGLSGYLTEEMSLSLEGYHKHYGSLVVFNQDKILPSDPDYVQGKGNADGVELMLRSRSSVIDLYGAYSLSWVKIDNEGLVYYPRYDRRHHINLMAIAHLVKGLNATLKWEFGSGFPFSETVGYFNRLTLDNGLPGRFELETGPPYMMLGEKNAARLPGYHRLDASVSYELNLAGFEIAVGADLLNLYNQKNIFYFDRTTGQRVNMLPFFPSVTLTVKR
jgi:hypothetical protein